MLGALDDLRGLDHLLLDGHGLVRGRLGGRRHRSSGRSLRGRGTAGVAAEHEEGAHCDRDAERADDEVKPSVATVTVSHGYLPGLYGFHNAAPRRRFRRWLARTAPCSLRIAHIRFYG